jgi:hypothetical protein
VLCWMLIPQFVAGIYAKSMGRSFWFWFFISFLIPIVSLIILYFLDKDEDDKRHSYKLADHVTLRDELKTKAENEDPDPRE